MPEMYVTELDALFVPEMKMVWSGNPKSERFSTTWRKSGSVVVMLAEPLPQQPAALAYW